MPVPTNSLSAADNRGFLPLDEAAAFSRARFYRTVSLGAKTDCGRPAVRHIHAAMRADKMMAKGDLDGFAVWRLIMKAVDELETRERPGSAKVH